MNCVKRIPSLLRGSVDLFVSSECIHLYCTLMFLSGESFVFHCTPDVPIQRIFNIIKSCKFIEVNPPFVDQGEKSPQLWGTRVIRLS